MIKITATKIYKILAIILCFLLCFEQSGFAQVAGQLDISDYITQLHQSLTVDKFRPLHLRYLSYDNLNNTFKLLLDKGDQSKDSVGTGLKPVPTTNGDNVSVGTEHRSVPSIETETKTLLNYFFIGVSLPNDTFWVNLRPDSPENMIDPLLASTDVGKILLEADVQLKKDTTKFTSPDSPEGREYWDKLYQKAGEIFGSENITIPTLTRPWIVPDEIIIRESDSNAYIYKATLKVMLEQDYLKDSTAYNFKDDRLKQLNEYSSQLIRELIIPKLTKEINISKRYAPLRQVYYSLIMAQWFKIKFYGKGGKYSSLIDRRNLDGLTSNISWDKDTYFQAYKESFEKGEYNIKEPKYTPFGQTIRSYFSGGLALNVDADIARAMTNPGRAADKIMVTHTVHGEVLLQSEGNQIAVNRNSQGGITIAPTEQSVSPDIAAQRKLAVEIAQEQGISDPAKIRALYLEKRRTAGTVRWGKDEERQDRAQLTPPSGPGAAGESAVSQATRLMGWKSGLIRGILVAVLGAIFTASDRGLIHRSPAPTQTTKTAAEAPNKNDEAPELSQEEARINELLKIFATQGIDYEVRTSTVFALRNINTPRAQFYYRLLTGQQPEKISGAEDFAIEAASRKDINDRAGINNVNLNALDLMGRIGGEKSLEYMLKHLPIPEEGDTCIGFGKYISAILSRLNADDARIINIISSLQSSEMIRPISREFQDRPAICQAAARKLVEIMGSSSNLDQILTASIILGDIGDAGAIESLKKAIDKAASFQKSDKEMLVKRAEEAISKIQARQIDNLESPSEIIGLLRDIDATHMGEEGAKLLAKIAPKAAKSPEARAIMKDKLIQIIKQEVWGWAQYYAIQALPGVGSKDDAIILLERVKSSGFEYLPDSAGLSGNPGKSDFGRLIIESLKKMGAVEVNEGNLAAILEIFGFASDDEMEKQMIALGQKAIPQLRESLKESNPWIKGEAARLLVKLGDRETFVKLASGELGMHVDGKTKTQLVDAIVGMGIPEARLENLDLLVVIYANEKYRSSAMARIAEIGEGAIPFLTQRYLDPHYAFADEAGTILKALGAQNNDKFILDLADKYEGCTPEQGRIRITNILLHSDNPMGKFYHYLLKREFGKCTDALASVNALTKKDIVVVGLKNNSGLIRAVFADLIISRPYIADAGREQIVTVLIEGLSNYKDTATLLSFARALACIGDSRAIPALAQIAQRQGGFQIFFNSLYRVEDLPLKSIAEQLSLINFDETKINALMKKLRIKKINLDDLILLFRICSDPELEKLVLDRQRILSEVEKRLSGKKIFQRNRPELPAALSKNDYRENRDLSGIENLQLLRLYLLFRGLDERSVLEKLALIVIKDLRNNLHMFAQNESGKSDKTEAGGSVLLSGGKAVFQDTASVSDTNGSYARADAANYFGHDKPFMTFHLHALSLDSTEIAGPSGWVGKGDVAGRGDFAVADYFGNTDAVVTPMGFALDDNGRPDKSRLRVNIDMYWKNEKGEPVVIDLGEFIIPVQAVQTELDEIIKHLAAIQKATLSSDALKEAVSNNEESATQEIMQGATEKARQDAQSAVVRSILTRYDFRWPAGQRLTADDFDPIEPGKVNKVVMDEDGSGGYIVRNHTRFHFDKVGVRFSIVPGGVLETDDQAREERKRQAQGQPAAQPQSGPGAADKSQAEIRALEQEIRVKSSKVDAMEREIRTRALYDGDPVFQELSVLKEEVKNLRSKREAIEWEALNGIPSVREGYTRLYRGADQFGNDNITPEEWARNRRASDYASRGEWFSSRFSSANHYANTPKPGGLIGYIDVRNDEVAKYSLGKSGSKGYEFETYEYRVPRDIQEALGGVKLSRSLGPSELIDSSGKRQTTTQAQTSGPGAAGPQKDGGKGGIDFGGNMPLMIQPIGAVQGRFVGDAQVLRSAQDESLKINSRGFRIVPVELVKKWQEIERLFRADIMPSPERLREYLQDCYTNGCVEQEIDKVLGCIADILRKEEERGCLTEASLKEILVALEQESSSANLAAALNKISVSPGEPQAVPGS